MFFFDSKDRHFSNSFRTVLSCADLANSNIFAWIHVEGGTRTLVRDADGFIFRPTVEAGGVASR